MFLSVEKLGRGICMCTDKYVTCSHHCNMNHMNQLFSALKWLLCSPPAVTFENFALCPHSAFVCPDILNSTHLRIHFFWDVTTLLLVGCFVTV